ncbi:MAG: type I-C CRISPR-associated protein Cas5c [Oscillospiraceae bacterium]
MSFEMKNELTFCVSGRYALFSDPLTRLGGEKSTLMVPSYQALKGIAESIYWKPSFIWVIDKVRVMKPIRTESKGIRPIGYGGGNDLSIYTYLRDVVYIVSAHFEFNTNRADLKQDWNENKHYFIAKRCIEKGGRRDVFLGTRECQAYVEPASFDDGEGYYDHMGEMEFGFSYHSIRYPDENGTDQMEALFWRPKMNNGIINFCRPDQCPQKTFLREMKPKIFNDDHFSGFLEEGLLDNYESAGGDKQ